jgi:transcriptional regulator with XRE-family HTH domain
MLNSQEFSNRLEFVIKHYELSAAIFADRIGVQRSSISHLLSGRNNPSLDFVVRVMDKFPEINFNWFVKGKGEIFLKDINEVPPIKNNTPTLFDQVLESPKESFKSNSSKVQSEPNLTTISSIDKKIKPIDKILVLYKDGSFDSYI